MGLALVLIGLILWLALGWFVIGLILIVIGIILLFVPAVPYGYSSWRRGPP
jgi:hypothetical protein